MSILADSLGPSYPSRVSPGLQECQGSMSVPAVSSPQDGRPQCQPQAQQRKNIQVRLEKNRPAAARHGEASMSDIPMDSSFDVLSGLVDFELFEQSMQSPDDDGNSSRNSQAPLDAHALLSSYQQLFDAPTAPAASSTFPPVF